MTVERIPGITDTGSPRDTAKRIPTTGKPGTPSGQTERITLRVLENTVAGNRDTHKTGAADRRRRRPRGDAKSSGGVGGRLSRFIGTLFRRQ
jgi:hypothetical protein